MKITYHHTFTLDCLPPGSIFRCDDDYYQHYLGTSHVFDVIGER